MFVDLILIVLILLNFQCHYIKDHGLMGGMFWALDLDDFRGTFCGQGAYPLMNQLKDCLGTYTGKQET